MHRKCTFLLFLVLSGYFTGVENRRDEVVASNQEQPEWWHNAVIYQIYTRSFMDSDGDGVGDLNGIIEKLRHLADMGVDCICLSPIFKSPMNNYGYDTSNFFQIDSELGTRKDIVMLKKNLKMFDIKLIIDFVPNHSSDEHSWFKKSEQRIDPYTDYYVWRDAKIDLNGSRTPPNNWQNVNKNSAWTWNEKRGQYYLHQFDPKQPDLNYRNEGLVKKIKYSLRFWMDQGVDGYRLPAVPFLFEEQRFLDERNEAFVQKEKNSYDKHFHDLTRDLTETHDMIHQFREVLDEYKQKDGKTRILITEAYTSIDNVMKYYGDETNPEAHVVFNYGLINDLNDHSKASDFKDAISKWISHMPNKKQANWAIGNNRRFRVATRFGDEMIDAMNMLNLLLPGIAFTYMGEEIGMTDSHSQRDSGTLDDGYHVLSETLSPYQWNTSTSAGCSSNLRTWNPVNSNYVALNLDSQKKSMAFSHYYIYKRMVRLRKTPTIRHGTYQGFVVSEWVFAFSRELLSPEWSSVVSDRYLVVINVGSQEQHVDVSNLTRAISKYWFVHTASTNTNYSKGDKLDGSSFMMKPKSALVLSRSKQDNMYDWLDRWSSSPPLVSPSVFSLVALWYILTNRYAIFDF